MHRQALGVRQSNDRIDARISLKGSIKSVTVNDESVDVEIESEWGRSRAKLVGLTVSPLKPLIIEAIR